MSKKATRAPRDYSKAIIYKLYCETADEIYVGSTVNFKERKRGHKNVCNNPNAKEYNFKVYQYIRENGGFENFYMEKIEDFPCNDKRELEKREREIKRELNATLNSNEPYREKGECVKIYYENNKGKIDKYQKDYYQINKDKIAEKKKEKINCECGSVYRRNDKTQHLNTKKHQNYLKSLE